MLVSWCFKQESINPYKKQTMGNLYKLTKQKEKTIRGLGYNYIEIWEHEWDDLVKTNKHVAEFVKSEDIQQPLMPRDALYGGRTNASKLFYHCEEGEKIRYLDFTSLYQYVQKTCKYPIGVPLIFTENFKDVQSYFGLITGHK